MCDFNTLDDEQKLLYYEKLMAHANAYGGVNFFLQLLEAIRETKPHPLTSRHSDFIFHIGNIKWGKVIFNDKILLLTQLRREESKRGNFLPSKEAKGYKKALNLVRTLAPITFTVRPKYKEDGEGFSFPVFDKIDEETIKLNPIFDVLFFCSLDTVKKILNYK
ncbi:MAG: hypothetical protein K0U38_11965 [Epsilonproteobacteria bacterium]|nr:hypothetical protein [Campylobacterota bacterium]